MPNVDSSWPSCRYHPVVAREGRLFNSQAELDNAGEGWVDSPAKFGLVTHPPPAEVVAPPEEAPVAPAEEAPIVSINGAEIDISEETVFAELPENVVVEPAVNKPKPAVHKKKGRPRKRKSKRKAS